MASIGSLLKDEITRLSRREIRRQVEPFKKASAAHRRHIAALKRQVVALQRQVATLGRTRTRSTTAATEAGAEASSNRFVAKGLKTLRARLGLSAAEFGKLVGVSGQSVYNWESKKAVPRRAQVAAIASLRSLGKKEVQARLQGGEGATAKPERAAKKRAAKKAVVGKRATRKAGAKKARARKTVAKKPVAKKARAAK